MCLLRFLLRVGLAFAAWLAVVRVVRRLWQLPMPAFLVPVLDMGWRKRVQPPGKVLNQVGLEPGTTVLELGPGTGYFTPEAARRLGPEGRLICLDIAPSSLERLRDKVDRLGLTTVLPCIGDAQRLPLADGSIDQAFLVAVLGEIPDPGRALGELHRVLRPGGVLAVTEFLPDPDYALWQTVQRQVEPCGFRLEERAGNFWTYTLRFRKS